MLDVGNYIVFQSVILLVIIETGKLNSKITTIENIGGGESNSVFLNFNLIWLTIHMFNITLLLSSNIIGANVLVDSNSAFAFLTFLVGYTSYIILPILEIDTEQILSNARLKRNVKGYQAVNIIVYSSGILIYLLSLAYLENLLKIMINLILSIIFLILIYLGLKQLAKPEGEGILENIYKNIGLGCYVE